MRDYAKVSPQFWTGRTGKALKASGPEAVIVAMYLMTSPHANMIGLYHCPIAYISIDTGLPIEGASKGLASCIEAEFCQYDENIEYVFVAEFAKYQLGDELDPKDKRCQGVANELAKVPKCLLHNSFRAHYAVPYHLPVAKPLRSPSEAPPKPRAGTRAGTRARAEEERGDTPLKPPAWSPPEWVPAEPWANFVLHRKAMRSVPFTDAARDGVVAELRKLADAGHDPAELLVTAVTRGWRTVFPPRANGASQPVGAMSEHGMQTMRNANALKARIFKEESHEA